MKPGTVLYILFCGITVASVMMANARGYVPFTPSAGRAGTNGSGGHGTAGYFHK